MSPDPAIPTTPPTPTLARPAAVVDWGTREPDSYRARPTRPGLVDPMALASLLSASDGGADRRLGHFRHLRDAAQARLQVRDAHPLSRRHSLCRHRRR